MLLKRLFDDQKAVLEFRARTAEAAGLRATQQKLTVAAMAETPAGVAARKEWNALEAAAAGLEESARKIRAAMKVRIKVLRAGPKQHITPNLVQGGVGEGWLTMGQGKIVIHGEDGDVVYRIERIPGRYTVKGQVEVINYFDCVKEA